MVSITVQSNFVESRALFYSAHEDEVVALKFLAAQFSSHFASTGMNVYVHSELIVNTLREDFGYHVFIQK